MGSPMGKLLYFVSSGQLLLLLLMLMAATLPYSTSSHRVLKCLSKGVHVAVELFNKHFKKALNLKRRVQQDTLRHRTKIYVLER